MKLSEFMKILTNFLIKDKIKTGDINVKVKSYDYETFGTPVSFEVEDISYSLLNGGEMDIILKNWEKKEMK